MQSLGGGYSHDCAKAIALVPFSRLHIKISVQILSAMDRHKDSPMDIKHTLE